MNNKKKIFFIEPQNLIRAGLVNMVRLQPNLEVVGEAENSTEAVVETIVREAPDVVVLAAEIGDQSSIEVVKTIKKAISSAHFLAIAGTRDKWLFHRLLKAGCRGYLLKSATESQFLDAIKVVSAGATYISQDMVNSLLGLAIHASSNEKGKTELSAREDEIMKLLAAGYSSRAIGEQKGLSPKTIDTYRSRILTKLNLRTRAELIRYCVQNRMVDHLERDDIGEPHQFATVAHAS